MTSPSTEREIRRRRYVPSFQAKVVAACLHSDTSIAQIALQHELNTNRVQTYIRKAKSQLPAAASLSTPSFTSGEIHIDEIWLSTEPWICAPARILRWLGW
ncbi:transposase [Halomonas sp. JS92-SW72]|uniref:transposase n=1 Tax=Halomonas sp. JS92-SW72 TaxID=2306583 RepID=UPI0013C2CFA2|nr:transposase [Halomonas sp. JS92-SW72]